MIPSDAMLENLPGAKIVERGIADLAAGLETEASLLVLVAAPRLRKLDLKIINNSNSKRPYEHALYGLIEQSRGSGAFSYYLSLIRKIISFARALESQRRWTRRPN